MKVFITKTSFFFFFFVPFSDETVKFLRSFYDLMKIWAKKSSSLRCRPTTNNKRFFVRTTATPSQNSRSPLN